MFKIIYVYLFFMMLILFGCNDKSTPEGDADYITDEAASSCKSDTDCNKEKGERCIESVCTIPECIRDADCIEKKKGNRCDLARYLCITEILDAGEDASDDVVSVECIDNCSERCRPDKICENGRCVSYGYCRNDNDCPCGWHCNGFEYKCEECASDEDCKDRTDGKTKCDIGKTFICVEPLVCNPPCNSNCQICKDGKCILESGKCCQDLDCPSNSCVNYECQEVHSCGEVCSTDQDCKDWCKDSAYICSSEKVCIIPQGCQKDLDCDPQCGAGLGQCIGGTCQCKCKNPYPGTGRMCSACNDDCDCDITSGFTCYEYNNPLNNTTFKACTHACSSKADCESPSLFGCIAGGGTLCACSSAQ